MVVSLTPERAGAIKEAAKRLLEKPNPTIRDLAEVIGKFVAAFQECEYGPLHYRQLENDKISALKESQGDYDAHVTLSTLPSQDLHWWIQNNESAKNPINHPKPTIVHESDASKKGWGAVYQGKSTGGRWTQYEPNAVSYINNMGGSHSAICNTLTREIWFSCIGRSL